MATLKLKPKQLEVLKEIQAQKAQVSKLFGELNQKESLTLELIFEANDIAVSEITNVQLTPDSLEYEYKPKESKTKKSKKVESKIEE